MIGPEGEEHWSYIQYISIHPKDYFIGLDGFADADEKVNTTLPQGEWKMSFSGEGNITLVTTEMKFSKLEDLETIIKIGFKEGYKIAGDGLDALLEEWKKA